MNKSLLGVGVAAMFCLFLTSAAVYAQSEEAEGTSSPAGGALDEGIYYTALTHYLFGIDSGQIDGGYGAEVGFGWSFGNKWAAEVKAIYTAFQTSDRGEPGDADYAPSVSSTRALGGSADALYFPFDRMPRLFFLAGAGGLEYSNYPTFTFSDPGTVSVEAGGGYLWRVGRFSIRTQAVFRRAERWTQVQRVQAGNSYEDVDLPHSFKDVLLSVGILLPKTVPPPPPAPVKQAVDVIEPVPPPPPPDSDGDGVTDDIDQCPGSVAGVAVDEVGCAIPDCESPEPGEKISLKGCGVGESIVLKGVNFEVDSDRLTPNAQAILDQVASELVANPGITVTVTGHTDSTGSDMYNMELSTRRAEAVKDYLVERGVAGERLTATGAGETTPIADEATVEGREQNRRVELQITGAGNDSNDANADGGANNADGGAAPAAPGHEQSAIEQPIAEEEILPYE